MQRSGIFTEYEYIYYIQSDSKRSCPVCQDCGQSPDTHSTPDEMDRTKMEEETLPRSNTKATLPSCQKGVGVGETYLQNQ